MKTSCSSRTQVPLGACRWLIGMAIAGLLVVAAPPSLQAQELPSIAEATAGTTAMEGFFNLYWDDSKGRMYWEIDKLDVGFIYKISMGSGLGSNPVG